ncbi:MAG: hypothetical protein ACYSUK_12910 [Planctomycetota bacterium]|jgi:hypothetical protein
MAYAILGTPKPQFFDSSGSPLASGTLTIQDPDDSSAKNTYPTATDADASTNGVSTAYTLDSRGEVATQLWGRDGEDYKAILKDSAGSTIYTIDEIRLPPKSRRATVTVDSSDATPSVAESKCFILNDSTTITNFDDGQVGDIIHIMAAGSSTSVHDIDHAATKIILAGKENFKMRQFDTLTLAMFQDQKWVEISRSVYTNGPKFLTADDVYSATTTLATVSDLSTWQFGPGVYVAVEAYLKVISSAITQDIKFALTPDNAFQEGHWTYIDVNEDGTTTADSGIPSTALTADIVNAKVHGIAVKGYFLTHASATASTVHFQAAQGTGAGTTTLEKGSWVNMYTMAQ